MLHAYLQSGNNVTIEGYSAVHEGNTDNYVPKWFTGTAITGTGASISSVIANSKAGDMYLNTSTDNVYKSSSVNVWDYVCNIKGNTGATGPQGPQGPQGPTGTTPTSIAWTSITGKPNFGHHSGGVWDTHPYIGSDGVIELGRYIDFHTDRYGSADYDYRIESYSGYLVGSGAFYTSSDRHIKKKVSYIDNKSLDELFKISDKLVKEFKYKKSGISSYGFIAQELEKFIPEAIAANSGNIKNIDYNSVYAKLFASLINEIKKLKNHVGLS